ncbi:Cysteine-rich repeat secretory protein 55 [Turnera subulata]|uniref:Cysteine-rich repeat secretory protein 55 n=1 Tax=Turnera subulata TaxID=218843 RepID=A0A9Q0J0K4_9ROSI|nr:Cysteine-rich repeat secretory protein 55 [Turnera subulata]
MDNIRSQAVVPKNEGLGKGETQLSSSVTLYALVQCTRDLAPVDCAECLAASVANFPNFCDAHPLGNLCNKGSVIGNKNQTSRNIDQLLSTLVSKTASAGYTATSSGQGQDKVYGLAQCRGDMSSKDCSDCIQDAANQIRQLCPDQADARIWYDYCFLRYAREDFIGKVDTGYGIFYYNVENATDPQDFDRKLGALADDIRSQAVVPKNEGLGKGETQLSSFVTLYALVQCTRDLAPVDCAQCLAISVGNFPNFCNSRKGCRVLYSSCYVRYELYPFFFPLDSITTSLDATTIEHSTIVASVHT